MAHDRRPRVRGAEPAGDAARQRQVVAAFLAASREGDFEALLALLGPDVVLRFAIDGGVIVGIELVADRERPEAFDVDLLGSG